MASLFDTTRNFSFYTIPAAWVIALAPHMYATTIAKKANLFDLRAPRGLIQAVEQSQSIDKATKDTIIRAESAQQNGFENIAFFATAVVAGNLAGIPIQTLNTLSGGYLLSRVMYTYIYINNTSESMANARTVAFLAGIAQVFTLFIKSGNILKDRAANLL